MKRQRKSWPAWILTKEKSRWPDLTEFDLIWPMQVIGGWAIFAAPLFGSLLLRRKVALRVALLRVGVLGEGFRLFHL
jgi:hypothetical protein